MRRNVLLSFLFLFAVFQLVDAQVKGIVNDQDGFAVADAEVVVVGTETSTFTNESGSFEIDAQVGDVLQITDMMGVAKEFNITNANMGVLSFGAEILSEAVILGYGISETAEQKTGSYVSVKAEDIEKVGSVSFDQALQGQVAGVSIGAGSGQPGANAQIFVRGITSLIGSSMPLVVVNGVPVTTGDMSGIAASSNPLANIDPSTIENVTVLKDAVATSLYGSRGANGVILVTLKKGKNSKGKFMFNTEFGVGDVAFEKADWLDAQGHMNFFATALANTYGYTYDESVAEIGWDGTTNSDWRNGVRHNAISSQKYVLNYSGGTDQMRLFTSLSYNDQDGIARDANFNRISGFLGADWTVSDKLGLNFDVTVSKARQTGPTDGSSYSNPVFAGNIMSPTQSIYNPDGSYNLDLYYLNPEFNPMALQERNLTQSDFYKAIINLGGDYDITKDLNFETKFGVDYNFYDELLYWNPDFGDGNSGHPLGNGYGYASQRNFNTWNWSNALRYNKTFADVHNLTLTAGTEAIKYNYSVVVAEKRGYPAGNIKPSLDNAANAGELTNSSGQDYSFMSYFGRLAYDFDGKFSLTGNIRRDGSSRFGQNNRWGTFWGVGAAVNVHRFINADAIDEIKVRGSYGTVGNAEIGNYRYMTLYAPSNGQYMGTSAGATTILGNPDLKWETTQQINVGVDLGFFQNRVRASVDVYEKKVKDLLYNMPRNQSGSQGFTVFMGNDGNLTSKGIEGTLSVVPIRGKDFEWTITGNYAYNDTKITNLNEGRIAVRNGLKAWENGHNPTEWYTRLWAGVNQEDGTPLWYTDETRTETTGDVSQAAQSFTGKQALPVHTAGLSTSLAYKGFVLSSQFTFAGGHSVYDRWGFVYNSDGAYAQLNTREEWANGAWTPENAGSATSPQVMYGGNNGSSTASTRYLYDADNIRWRSAEFGYKFGKTLLGEKVGLDNIYVYVKGYNLVVWTFDKDLWFDPEVATNDPAFFGIENMGMYNMTQPNLRQFVFGVRLDF